MRNRLEAMERLRAAIEESKNPSAKAELQSVFSELFGSTFEQKKAVQKKQLESQIKQLQSRISELGE